MKITRDGYSCEEPRIPVVRDTKAPEVIMSNETRGDSIRQGLANAIAEVGRVTGAMQHTLTPTGVACSVVVPAEEWALLNAEVCGARIEKITAAIAQLLAEAEAEGLPPGSRASWRRGTWA